MSVSRLDRGAGEDAAGTPDMLARRDGVGDD